jgi:lysophospholipase L1-like esterase
MNKQGKRWLPHILIAGILLADTTHSAHVQANGISWVGTWASPPVQGDATHNLGNRTLRQIVHTSIAGSRARVQISNLFGTQPLRIEDVHIAQKGNGSSIVPGTDRQIRFHGQTAITIAPATAAISDAVTFAVPSLSDVAISLYLPALSGGPATVHPSAHQTSYVAPGDVSGQDTLPTAETIKSYYFITSLDVQNDGLLGSVVALGASITEGYNSTEDMNRRWSDVLAQKLSGAGLQIGVLNAGISGNRLLRNGAGPSVLNRFERDVLEQTGIHWVVFADAPINDLGASRDAPTASELISGIKQLIARAHLKHVQFFCSTLTPYEGANYWTPAGEAAREQINSFVRSDKSNCDAVIDQDAATHDPDHPTRFLPAYDSGDHLHPNDAGLMAIANAASLLLIHQVSVIHPGEVTPP